MLQETRLSQSHPKASEQERPVRPGGRQGPPDLCLPQHRFRVVKLGTLRHAVAMSHVTHHWLGMAGLVVWMAD